MFYPRRLCSGKPFIRPHRAETLVVLYSRDVEYRIFKILRQFRIDQAHTYSEH